MYYGHNFNSKNLAGNRYLNVFLSGIVEIPALLLLVLINNKLGRRWTSALYMLISGLASFSILIIHLTGVFKNLDIALCVNGIDGLEKLYRKSIGYLSSCKKISDSFKVYMLYVGVSSCFLPVNTFSKMLHCIPCCQYISLSCENFKFWFISDI